MHHTTRRWWTSGWPIPDFMPPGASWPMPVPATGNRSGLYRFDHIRPAHPQQPGAAYSDDVPYLFTPIAAPGWPADNPTEQKRAAMMLGYWTGSHVPAIRTAPGWRHGPHGRPAATVPPSCCRCQQALRRACGRRAWTTTMRATRKHWIWRSRHRSAPRAARAARAGGRQCPRRQAMPVHCLHWDPDRHL